MYEDDYREVDYCKYCKTCLHEKKSGFESPCEECLDNPVNQYTDRPINWAEKE